MEPDLIERRFHKQTMQQQHRPLRLVPSVLAIALAAACSAQVSNVTSQLAHNNVERGFDATNTEFGFTQQFVIAPNPPTTFLQSPATDVVLVNPLTGGAAELKAQTTISGNLSVTATSASVSGSGLCGSDVISRDGTSSYQSVPATEADLSLHLASAETVTFAVNDFVQTNGGLCVYGIDNTLVDAFTTNGNHSFSATIGAGDHGVFLYFFANSIIGTPGEVSTSANGNYSITVDTRPVPEPASMSVLGLGVIALIRRRRKG